MPTEDEVLSRARDLSLRPASEGDAHWLRALRNEVEVRATSRNPAEVGADEHAAWLAGVLADPNRHLEICELDGRAVGQVRLDRLREGRYEISTALIPEARGLGLAGPFMSLAIERLRDSHPEAEVEAHVGAENSRSLGAVHQAGFRPTGETDEDGFLVLLASPASADASSA
jgi:RimJ/RimL family protein N-acetyltransferase